MKKHKPSHLESLDHLKEVNLMETKDKTLQPSDVKGHSIPEVTAIVAEELKAILAILDKPGRTGGYFRLDRVNEVPIIDRMRFGSIRADKGKKYHFYAGEKVGRFIEYEGHISTYQSRDDTPEDWMEKRYGGGIQTDWNYRLAFSGLPELADEALVLRIAIRLGIISISRLRDIIAISNNPFITNTGELQPEAA